MKINLSGLLRPGGNNASFFKHSTLVFLMRAGFVYVVIGIITMSLLFAHESNSQALAEIKVNVELNDETLPQLFQKIQAQTNLVFGYRVQETDKVAPLTLGSQTLTVKALLDLVFTGTPLKYKQVNNSVIVYEEEPVVDDNNSPRYEITGAVKDKAGVPLPGVSVLIKGTNVGTTTDAEGFYSIDVPGNVEGNPILVFSFIGYKKIEEPVSARLQIHITMEEEVNTLQEVTINGGYYETTDELKTGSIVRVSAKDIERQPVTSPIMALQGRVPGIEIIPVSGAPGMAPTIRIRGTNSLRGNQVAPEDRGNYPLYVIDGIPVSSMPVQSWGTSFTSGGYDPLSTLNPANIESIEVLKDGDATAIYGSRGANGVILITTKKNSKNNERTNFDISSFVGVGDISRRLKVLDTRQYIAMRKEALLNDGLSAAPNDFDLVLWDTTRYTDWQKTLIGGTSNITDIQSNISSGTKNTSFRLGGGYHKETLVFPGDFGYHRISAQASINHTSTNNKFNVAFSSNYGLDKSRMFNDGGLTMINALTLPPNAPRLRNSDGTLNWEPYQVNGNSVSTWLNPLSHLEKTQLATNTSLLANTTISYEVLPNLTLSTNAGYTFLMNRERFTSPQSSQPPEDRATVPGGMAVTGIDRNSWLIEPKLSFSKKVGEHNIEFIAGATWQKTTTALSQIFGEGFISDALLGSLAAAQLITVNSDNTTDYRYISIYARGGYRWKDKYIVNLTGRRDGSSRFGPGNRFGNFGAIGAAWIFSKESFFQRLSPILSFGKLRTSYGITGNDQIGDYKYYNLYTLRSNKYGGQTGLAPDALENPDFAWEVTKKYELAVELGFLENRIGLEVGWYRNQSSNQLVSSPLSGVTGFDSVIENFNATVQNSGIEGVVRIDLLNSDTWRWNLSLNASLPKTKLVKFNDIENSPYVNTYRVGEPLSVRWVYTYKGVNPETGLYDFEDKNSDGVINDLDKSVVNMTRNPVYGGITSTIQYKQFEVALHFQFSNAQSALVLKNSPGQARGNQPVMVTDRWQNPGDVTEFQKYSTTNLAFVGFLRLLDSDANVADAAYLRLKTLSVSYRFPAELVSKIKTQNASLFIQGQNLLTFTRYKGLDPETGNSLPPLRMITVGVQVKL